VRYWSLGGAYVLNTPFFGSVWDKLSELHLCDRLGILHPQTVLLPGSNPGEDVREIVAEPEWDRVADAVGFPCVIKPVDGYAWDDVFTVESLEALRGTYDGLKARRTLIAQRLVVYEAYYRVFTVGARDALVVRWKPLPYDMGEYSMPGPGELGAVGGHIVAKTLELNAALGLDFNAVEWCVTADGAPCLIDAHNDVPAVRADKLPPACYEWIVDRFSACVREKCVGGGRNPVPSGQGSEPGAPAG
jgi:hypothetical protein